MARKGDNGVAVVKTAKGAVKPTVDGLLNGDNNGKKQSSKKRKLAETADKIKDESAKGSTKKQATVQIKNTPPLSAVAARKLAAAEEARKASLLMQPATVATSASIQQQIPEQIEQEDLQSGSDNDSDDVDSYAEYQPVASTSKQPFNGIIDDSILRGPKRYFSAISNATQASGASSQAGGEADNHNNDDDEDANEQLDGETSTFANSEGEYIGSEKARGASSSTYARKSSRRRRRGDNFANFYLDPLCASTWRPNEENQLRIPVNENEVHTVIGMYPGETLVIRGTCKLSVLRGSISIDCAKLHPHSAPLPLSLFAPSTHALPVIRASRAASSDIAEKEWPYTVTEQPALEQPILVVLQSLRAGLEGIESLCKLAGMPIPQSGMWYVPNRWHVATSQSDSEANGSNASDSFKILLEPERDLCSTIIPHNWQESLSNALLYSEDITGGPSFGQTAQSYIVQGPKGVGKSTFAKLLVNSLLAKHGKVAYLDCDLGQPEFTPSGFVSLSYISHPMIGPSFTHLSDRPEKMHYIGSATPKDDPARYLASIADLYDVYTSSNSINAESVPLVINSQGWYKGLGADLLLEIHRMATPTTCFDFSASGSQTEQNGFHVSETTSAITASPDTRIIPLQMYMIPENAPPRFTASDLRILQIVSYFHLSPSSFPRATPTWDFENSLIAKRPYNVPWSTFGSIRLAVNEHVPYEELLRALDVSVVSLERSSSPHEEQNVDQPDGIDLRSAYETGLRRLDYSSESLGLGIIRAVDVEAKTFQLLTPVATSELDHINALVKGDIELPTVLMVDNSTENTGDESGLAGVEWRKVPYLEHRTSSNVGVGHAERRVRRNVMRRSQFR